MIIDKTPKAIRESLRNNCWYTYLCTGTDLANRIIGVRIRNKRLQVQMLTGTWTHVVSFETIEQK